MLFPVTISRHYFIDEQVLHLRIDAPLEFDSNSTVVGGKGECERCSSGHDDGDSESPFSPS